jgi:hypothetical protein
MSFKILCIKADDLVLITDEYGIVYALKTRVLCSVKLIRLEGKPKP